MPGRHADVHLSRDAREDLRGRPAHHGGRALRSRHDAVPDRDDRAVPVHAHGHRRRHGAADQRGQLRLPDLDPRNRIQHQDQPDGDWKYIWSHIHKPVKDLFWDTFHKEGKRYNRRPTAAEWLEAFKAYKAYLGNKRLNFDPMSNDVRPIRNKAFKPDTPIEDCSTCGRKHAIAGIWNDDDRVLRPEAVQQVSWTVGDGRGPVALPASPIRAIPRPSCHRYRKNPSLRPREALRHYQQGSAGKTLGSRRVRQDSVLECRA